MYIIAAALLGALWGGYKARRRKGTGLDIAQYAAAYGLAFSIVGLFLTVLIERLG